VEDNGGFQLSSTKFGLKLGDRGYQKEKSGTVVYRGIGLLDTSDSWDGFSGSTPDTPYTSRDSGKPSQPSKLSGNTYLAASRGE